MNTTTVEMMIENQEQFIRYYFQDFKDIMIMNRNDSIKSSDINIMYSNHTKFLDLFRTI